MAVRKIKIKLKTEDVKVYINTPFIKLDSALKLAGAVPTGGMAKMLIENGEIKVNGEICTLRGKKIYPGDKIYFKNLIFWVEKSDENM